MSKIERWWERWWAEDYSWEGLLDKPWKGWGFINGELVPDPRFSPNEHSDFLEAVRCFKPANLQDYWKQFYPSESDLIEIYTTTGKKKFTPMHLPLETDLGKKTAKQEWPTHYLDPVIRQIINESENLPHDRSDDDYQDCRCQFQGCVFLPLTRDVPHWGASFDKTFQLSAVNAYFENFHVQEGTRFGAHSSFVGAAFVGDAFFQDVTFERFVSFMNATFVDAAVFKSARFTGEAIFTGAEFRRNARFERAVFASKAKFISATFEGRSRFSNAFFNGEVDFSGHHNGLRTSPVQLNFTAHGITDNDRIDMSGGVLSSIEKTDFAHRAIQYAAFDGIICMKEFSCRDRDFVAGGTFQRAVFFDLFQLHGSRLHQALSFDEVLFSGTLRPLQHREVSEGLLVRIHHHNRRIDPEIGGLEGWRCDFLKSLAERGNDQSFHERNSYFEKLESCFRILKLAMEDTRDRNMEGYFFQLELKARRQRTGERMNWFQAMFAKDKRSSAIEWWEPAFSDAYGAFSVYGTSIMRPIVWIAYLMFGSAAIYLMLAHVSISGLWVKWPNWADFWQALSFSAGRMLGFGPWQGDPPEQTMMHNLLFDWGGHTAFGVRMLASIQSVMAIVLVFLSGLAVRRKFQIT